MVIGVLVGCGERSTPGQPIVDVLVTGASISGANGIHFAPDGRLFVASVIGNELLALDPESGEVLQRWTPAEGVEGPDDVAFGPDGSFFWTSILTGEVAGFRADGTRVTAAKLGPGVNPITFSDDGRLFVAQCFFGDQLFEVDPNGIDEPQLLSDELGPGCGLNGMDWGPDGRLYGPRWFLGEVVSFDVDTLDMRLEAADFEVPAAVKFDAEGRLNVLDTFMGEIVRFDGEEREVLARLSPGLDNFTFDDGGRLFVSSFTDGFVGWVDETGELIEISPAGMAHPGGVAVFAHGGQETVVVADVHAIRGFDPATGSKRFTQRNILGVSPLGSAINVAPDGDRLILVSWIDNNVRVWDPASETVVERFDDLGQPVSAVRFGSGLAIAEHVGGRVILINNEKTTILAENLQSPTGLAVSGGNLFVSDRAAGRVLQIAADGAAVAPRVVAAGLALPEGIAVTERGIAVVEGESGRVVLVSASGAASVVGRIAPGTAAQSEAQPPSMVFNGVAAGVNALFATGETDRVLYRIEIP
jgi:sugar lactone lactonase YvrE